MTSYWRSRYGSISGSFCVNRHKLKTAPKNGSFVYGRRWAFSDCRGVSISCLQPIDSYSSHPSSFHPWMHLPWSNLLQLVYLQLCSIFTVRTTYYFFAATRDIMNLWKFLDFDGSVARGKEECKGNVDWWFDYRDVSE